MSHLFTFSSDTRAAFSFLRRGFVFSLPILALAVPFEIAMFRTGETWPVSRVVHVQDPMDDYLYSRIFLSQQFNRYKYLVLQRRQPEVLILGSSRVMQVRDFMFHPIEGKVYNAGGMVQNVADVSSYAELLQSGELPKPEVVIVGIDPWWFKTVWKQESWLTPKGLKDDASRFSAHVDVASGFIRDRYFPWDAVRRGALSPSPGYGIPAIGAHALINGVGFRPDGSRLYRPQMFRDFIANPVYVDREVPPVVDRIRGNREAFRAPFAMDVQLIDTFVGTMVLLRDMGIKVYTFIPPFSDDAWSALDASATQGEWWHSVRIDLPAMLKESGISLLPVGRPSDYGLDDRYMIDGWHPSEVFMAHIMRRLIRTVPNDPLLAGVDLDNIQRMLDAPSVNPLTFNPPTEP